MGYVPYLPVVAAAAAGAGDPTRCMRAALFSISSAKSESES